LNNNVPCTLWLRDVTEIQPVDPSYLSGIQAKNVHVIQIPPITLLWHSVLCVLCFTFVKQDWLLKS
jgi:hypothetical protein